MSNKPEPDFLLEFLINLTGSSTIRKLSGEPKKLFKYVLGMVFLNLINSQQFEQGQHQNIRIACDILERPKESNRKYNLEQIKKQVQDVFAERHFKSPYEDATIEKVYLFFREKLVDVKKGKIFFLASELEEIFEIVPYFAERGVPIKPHHWIEFSINDGLIPTQPEFITYTDMINLWNLSMEQKSIIEDFHNKSTSYKRFGNVDSSFELRSTMQTLLRNCVVAAITFAESYLYFLFYDFKKLRLFEDNPKIKALYDKDDREYIQDTEIMKNLIFTVFPNIKSDKQLNKLYKDYSKINKTRNGIIHTSVSRDSGNQQPKLLTGIHISIPLVQEYLTTITNFVFSIDESLPIEHRILFWRDKFKDPDFMIGKKITLKHLEESYSTR